ncbi:MAG: TldD/PmbA family protein [Candidatus Jordarchaeales archaeon]|nr:TldD/PmbA family protein [Candidatus Jordarchaeia archaeon]
MEAAEKALRTLSAAKYADVRVLKQQSVHVALRGDSAEHSESRINRLVCRCIARGYGVAQVEVNGEVDGREVGERALRQAMVAEGDLQLVEVKVEEGEKRWVAREEFDVERAEEILVGLRNAVYDHLKNVSFRLEAVATFTLTDSFLITSEGTRVREVLPLTDLVAYLVVRGVGEGFSSLCVGGVGGLETVAEWWRLVEEFVAKAVDSANAKPLSSTFKWRKQTVILDCEAAGALAHETAHMLEGDLYTGQPFKSTELPEEFMLVDDPLLEHGYGSFQWDDEGVKAKRKLLLTRGNVRLLHTRLSAPSGDEAGNAHGVNHKPRPMMSNIYIAPSDWKPREIIEETREGIYVKASSESWVAPFSGLLQLTPEVAYLVEKGEEVKPVKGLRVAGLIPRILACVDAIGNNLRLKPNVEKGFNVSEGGPQLRIKECRILAF